MMLSRLDRRSQAMAQTFGPLLAEKEFATYRYRVGPPIPWAAMFSMQKRERHLRLFLRCGTCIKAIEPAQKLLLI